MKKFQKRWWHPSSSFAYFLCFFVVFPWNFLRKLANLAVVYVFFANLGFICTANVLTNDSWLSVAFNLPSNLQMTSQIARKERSWTWQDSADLLMWLKVPKLLLLVLLSPNANIPVRYSTTIRSNCWRLDMFVISRWLSSICVLRWRKFREVLVVLGVFPDHYKL